MSSTGTHSANELLGAGSLILGIRKPPTISQWRFKTNGILVGVPIPTFLLTFKVRSSTISTSKYLYLSYANYIRFILFCKVLYSFFLVCQGFFV